MAGTAVANRGELVSDLRAALGWLRRLEAEGGGYERRGVRGWALREEVEVGAGVFLWERLPKLWRWGLLTREDVKAPGRSRPVWLYRITEDGARRVADPSVKRRGVAPPGPLTDDDAAVYLPPGARLALDALRLAGEPAWRPASAVAEAMRLHLPDECPPTFSNESLQWLVRAGLAERRVTEHAVRAQPQVLWRVTPEGLALRVLRPVREAVLVGV